jgi:hypothetical protein
MPKANVQLVVNSRDRTGASTYNNAKYNAINQNLVQGQIHSVSVAEVNFPYDIPNVQSNVTDIFSLTPNTGQLPGDPVLTIQLPDGFYTGTELAAAITAVTIAEGAAAATPVLPADVPTCTYDNTSNRFTFTLVAPVTPGLVWNVGSDYTYPENVPAIQRNTLGKDIFSIMGNLPSQQGGQPTISVGFPFVSGGSAPLAFTQYVDICSPQLCQFQSFRDGSTTNLARRADVICRLYIASNIATQEEEGTRPFLINRQYNNERVMRWSVGSSIGSMDIQLYDDVGQPLQTSWAPRPYQLTFNVYELDKDNAMY